MPFDAKPWVRVEVDAIPIEPGQTITLYVTDHNGHKTQVEVRCVGRVGDTVGHPEIFCDDGDFVPVSFDEWRSIEDTYRARRGLPREPKPARREE